MHYLAVDVEEEIPDLRNPSPFNIFQRSTFFEYRCANPCFQLDNVKKL
jgi:hypothetical protein